MSKADLPWVVMLAAGAIMLPLGWVLAPKCPYCGEKHTRLDRHVWFDHADLPTD
jgi:hypothetical protein